jgi:hypothetical protein
MNGWCRHLPRSEEMIKKLAGIFGCLQATI